MATFSEMCPGVAAVTNNVDGACPALQGIEEEIANYKRAWSARPYSAAAPIYVDFSSGAVNASRSYNTYYAFCK